jgi:hypothetical protein
MAKILFKSPLSFQNGTGFTTNPADTEFRGDSVRSVTFSIPQAVSPSSSVVFNTITPTNIINIDNGALILSNGGITGSFTQTGNQNISSDLIVSGNLNIDGILTAEKVETEVSQAVTLFESGSTRFGDTLDDEVFMTGSMFTSGSLQLNAGLSAIEITSDTTLADESQTSIVTENVMKTYTDDQTSDFQTYVRKSFAYTGTFVSSATASFNAITASAPSGFTSTSEDDFMFFINGNIAEHDALTIQQSGGNLLLKINNNSVGYDLESSDEIIAFGKFNS